MPLIVKIDDWHVGDDGIMPTGAEDMLVTDGGGGGLMVRVKKLDICPSGFLTVIFLTPAVAIFDADTVVANHVVLCTVSKLKVADWYTLSIPTCAPFW